MEGFISTSLEKSVAKTYITNNGNALLEIKVKENNQP